MEQELMQLMRTARLQNAVAENELDNGTFIFAYPLDNGVVVGVGMAATNQQQVSLDSALRRRGSNMVRYGDWMPVLLADGRPYMVRRFTDYDDSQPVLFADDLAIAGELLQ